MLPHEVQATMAKVLFLVFATFVLCFGRARAEFITDKPLNITSSVQSTVSK